jgi:hypothetical protein
MQRLNERADLTRRTPRDVHKSVASIPKTLWTGRGRLRPDRKNRHAGPRGSTTARAHNADLARTLTSHHHRTGLVYISVIPAIASISRSLDSPPSARRSSNRSLAPVRHKQLAIEAAAASTFSSLLSRSRCSISIASRKASSVRRRSVISVEMPHRGMEQQYDTSAGCRQPRTVAGGAPPRQRPSLRVLRPQTRHAARLCSSH